MEMLSDDDLKALVPDALIEPLRQRAMTPDRPVLRGTAQNPDAFFQGREACNPFYAACPNVVQAVMAQFAQVVGRSYNLFDYVGAPDAERVMVLMGSGCEAAHETADYLIAKGEKVGVLKVRLYRPFAAQAFVEALPASVKSIAVLDRTKEPGAAGEPLYQDVLAALAEGLANGSSQLKAMPKVVGGPLRSVLQGIHPGDGQGGVRQPVRPDAEEPFHRRHQRRRLAPEPAGGPGLFDRIRQGHPRDVLRPGRGRHGGRQQELDQDHRRRHGQLRAGLFRLRLEEVRQHDGVAPAVRARADSLHLPGQPRQLRGLPPAGVPGADTTWSSR